MNDDIIEGTHPTRMELLLLKHKLKLAEKGHNLLKEKRDALMVEFMEAARDAEDIVFKTTSDLQDAYRLYDMTNALVGPSELASYSIGQGRDIIAKSESKNVMGIKIEHLSIEDPVRSINSRGYGLMLSNPLVDSTALAFEKSLTNIIELSSIENTLNSLSKETKKTKRRVNALEYRVMPRLKGTMKYVQMRLDELEREGFFRLKMIKRKRGGG